MFYQIVFISYLIETILTYEMIFNNTTCYFFNNNNNSLAKTLRNYRDYDLIVHCDLKTLIYVNEYVNRDNDHIPRHIIINYDTIDVDFVRPRGKKYLNLIHFKVIPERFLYYAQQSHNLRKEDVAIFVIDDDTFVNQKIIIDAFNFVNIASLIIYWTYNDTFTIKNVKDDRFVIISKENLIDHINRYDDFDWQEFAIGYTILRPHLWCKLAK